jgi:aminoglycoside phosphotransferase (APT) family kinase protein
MFHLLSSESPKRRIRQQLHDRNNKPTGPSRTSQSNQTDKPTKFAKEHAMDQPQAEASSTLPSEILQWIETEMSAPVSRSQRVPGGSTREAWLVDVGHGEARQELFLRFDRRPAEKLGIFWPLQVEAKVFRALQGTGVTVPVIHAFHPTLQAILAERVAGETWFYRITDPAEQVSTAQDFIRNLAKLHRIDAHTLYLPDLGAVQVPAEHTRLAIAGIRGHLLRLSANLDPFLAVCLDWLEANIPAYEGPTVLVQGDTGPGNFMYRNGKVTAVVDWELAHFGDPMDDIAWLSLRAVQDTFTYFPDRLAEYEQLTGFTIDEPRVWYYRLLGEVQLAAVGLGKRTLTDVARSGGDAGNSLIYGLLHRRLLIEAFANAAGVALDARPTYGPPEPSQTVANSIPDVHEALLLTLKTVADQAGDPLAIARTKAAARLVRYLKDLEADGPRIAAEELSDIASVLQGKTSQPVPSSIEEAQDELFKAVQSGHVSTLHDRTWPPLR